MSCLRLEEFSDDPIKQFEVWFRQAYKSEEKLPNASSLSTISLQGYPTSRVILLKSFDYNGFLFFSSNSSRKIEEIKQNPKASLLFYWNFMERQVRVLGEIYRVSTKEALFCYLNRTGNMGSWIEDKTATLNIRRLLEHKLGLFLRESIENKGSLAWSGYRLIPDYFEFWQGCEEELYKSIEYKRIKDAWSIQMKD